jgi:hypothetical protein
VKKKKEKKETRKLMASGFWGDKFRQNAKKLKKRNFYHNIHFSLKK